MSAHWAKAHLKREAHKTMSLKTTMKLRWMTDHQNVAVGRADELSLHPSDDEKGLELLTGTATAHNNPPDGNEHEFLSELADMLEKNENSGPPVTKQLADITDKRWGKHLPPEKIKLLMGLYETPENCSELLPVRVNPKIWDQLNATRQKTDLQLSNIQQTACKVAIAILQVVNDLLPRTKDEANKKLASRFVDSIAMLGHMSSDLSHLGREQIRPTLKREFATICTKDIPNGPLLFGSDLPKQLKEAKEAYTIGNSIAVQTLTKDPADTQVTSDNPKLLLYSRKD